MKTAIKNVFLAASLAALAVPVTALATETKSPVPKQAVQKGKKHEQKHIAHSVQKRKRTAGEAASLERKEAGSTEDRDMRDDNRGRLTSAHRSKLQHQQNRASKANDHKKHNATVASAHAKAAPGPRPQQHRTAELKTGQMTTRQAAHLETKETSLHREIHSDREQDAGKLTPEDQSNQPQNKNTNQIHLKKHNARMF